MILYQTTGRVGPSATGKDGKLKLVSALDMLQDCSLLWMESEPEFEGYLRDNGLGLLLVFRQMDVLRGPAYKEQVIVRTSIFGCKDYFGYRNTVMYDAAGAPCILSWSVGVFVNMQNGGMARLPQSIMHGITFDEKTDMEYLPKKIKLPDTAPESLPAITLRRSDIDIYGHVNNVRYIDAAMEVLPLDFEVQRLRVEYKKAAVLGDTLYPLRIKASEGLYYVLLTDQNGRPYTIIEFSK